MPAGGDPRQLERAAVACPVCDAPLALAGGSARCEAGHSFDFARSGYLNLTRGGGGRVGDSAEMVRARERFLGAGHYEPLARAVAEAIAALDARAGEVSATPPAGPESGRVGPEPVLAELGSGTGHYLDASARALARRGRSPGAAVGVDLSKAAADRAAKLHPEHLFLVADVEAGIPLRNAAADLCLAAFAPRPAAELARVTRPGGGLLVAMAAPRHLRRLRERLGLIAVDEDKPERLGARLAPWFDPASSEAVEFALSLSPADARDLVLMGPNARHDPELGPLAGGLEDVASVTVASFRRRQ